MNGKKIPKRHEVPVELTWKLEDVFEDDGAWLAKYEELKALPEKVAAFQGRLGRSAGDLLAFMKLQDEVDNELERLGHYAHCNSDTDTANGKYIDFKGKATMISVQVYSAASFAVPEIIAIPGDTLEKFYAECPELEVYRRPIYSARRAADHTLSPECENLLAMSGEMSGTAGSVSGIFRNADLRFPDVTDSDGAPHKLTNSTLVPLLESSDPAFRKRVFDAYYGRLDEYINTFSALMDAQFKSLRFYADARGYNGTLEAALDGNEVPVAVYHNLIDAVHANLDKMHRYVSIRKKMLGLDELHMSDVYVPMVVGAAKPVTFEQAKQTVIKGLSVLGDDYTALLEEGFANRWIDVYENEGKVSGAYSTFLADPHPYVLLNHKDNLDSMFTLAHEMGHALHSYHSYKYQPVCTRQYVIFVAEVASTCNEVLLMKHLLSETSDKTERAYLINHFLDQFKGTVYRQTMFAEFERFMGEMSESGQTLTAELLCNKYLELNKLYFGPDMVSDDGIAFEWARIPHFYTTYYVYQYATGFSAAVAIANRILKEGAPAVADYKKFLSSGGCSDPISLLKIAGVDMSSPQPVNEALALFGELLDELENL